MEKNLSGIGQLPSEWQEKNNTFPSDGRNNPLNLAAE